MLKYLLGVLLVPLALLGLYLLTGCNKASLLNATVSGSSYKLQKDVTYGSHSRAKLDVYAAKNPKPNAPLVMFIYGGSWQEGSKDDYPFAAQAFAQAGYTTLVPDYRLYPEVKFPAFVNDIAEAVAWSQTQSFDGSGQPQKVVLIGHSAGAHIASLLNLDHRYMAARNLSTCNVIAGTIGLAGPYDFLPLKEPVYRQIFPQPVEPAAQAINFVNPNSPPMMLLTGDDDTTVNPQNGRTLHAALSAVGAPAVKKEYAGIGHVGIVTALAGVFRGRAPVLEDSLSFITSISNGQQFCRL